MRWTDHAVREALGQPGPGRDDLVFSGIGTDSRRVVPGTLFVALAGERFDGHDYLEAAFRAGATAAVVRRGVATPPGVACYAVDDTLVAYGQLARFRRRSLTGPVVAVTGSNGKTSTKELLAAALRTRYRTHATRVNLNNLVGVPLTILEAEDRVEALVVEAGANQRGEMARCRGIIEPSITVITNVAAAHLEGFGSLEGVLTEKLALARDVPVAVVGTDPPTLAAGARRIAGRVVTAGLADADVTPDRVELAPDGRPTVEIGGRRFTLSLLGRHQAANAALAWAVAVELGLDLDAVAEALARCSVPGSRGEWRQLGGLTVLDDSYNANPASYRCLIDLVRGLRAGRRLVVVAGGMRELGEASVPSHAEIAACLVDLEPEVLAGLGAFVPALEPYRQTFRGRLLLAADADELAPELLEALEGNELVVLKGSRGEAVERLLPRLAAWTGSRG